MRPQSRAVRILMWGVVASWGVSLLRRILLPGQARELEGSDQYYPMQWPIVAKPIPLHRDPWCGTYVSPEISVRWQQAGRIEHFCSSECLDRYARSQHTAVSA
jgi:hypothetical protein